MVLFHGKADDPSGEVAVYSVAYVCSQEVVGCGSDPRACKSRAKFPGMILGGSTKPISLTMESSDTIGRPYPHHVSSLFVAMGISTLISLREREETSN